MYVLAWNSNTALKMQFLTEELVIVKMNQPTHVQFTLMAFNVLDFTATKQNCSFDILLVKQRCLKRKQVLGKKLRIVKNERNRTEPTEITLMWPNTPATSTWFVASVAYNRNMTSISVCKIHEDIFVPYKITFFISML